MTHVGLFTLTMLVGAMLAVGTAMGASEKDYSDLFPKASPGWTAGGVESKTIVVEPHIGDNLELSRRYSNVKTKGRITIFIGTNDCFGSALIKDAYENGEISRTLKMEKRPYEFAGYKGAEAGPVGRPTSVQLIVAPCKTVAVLQENAEPGDIAKYLKAMDFRKVEKFEGSPGLFW